jgi:hypothetical protein
MKLCFRFVAKLSTKMQNETQFLRTSFSNFSKPISVHL